MKKILLIINILSLLAALIWLITKPDWEPLVTSLGLVATLIPQLLNKDEGSTKINMSQKGGPNSTNYQSARDINIKNDKR